MYVTENVDLDEILRFTTAAQDDEADNDDESLVLGVKTYEVGKNLWGSGQFKRDDVWATIDVDGDEFLQELNI